MTKKDKALARVIGNTKPASVKFAELTVAMRAKGFVHDRTEGSHQIWVNPERDLSMNIQPDPKNKGMAKAYQVRQLRDLMKGE